MIVIRKKKINMSKKLKAKIDWPCRFHNKSYEITIGNLRIIKNTNLAYVEPHINCKIKSHKYFKVKRS